MILPKDAYLLKVLRLVDKSVPDIAQEKDILIYQETTASRYPNIWLREIYQEYDYKIVLSQDVKSAQDKLILCFSFFDINELPSIRPVPGSLYVYSSSEPHGEEQEMDFCRLHNWPEHFDIAGFGLPIEKDGVREIPDSEKGLHASGHACGPDLINIAREINPDILIPVHCENPSFYIEGLKESSIKIILPSLGKKLDV